jgi:tetratricopeptide (TPR) repeat protein
MLVLDRQIDRAVLHLERALELAEALRLPEVLAQALTSKSVVFTQRNRLEEARILLEGALERALENDLHAPALRAFNNLAVVYESSDRYAEAFDIANRGLELARRVGNRAWEMGFTAGPLSCLVLLGRWDEAIDRGADLEPTIQDIAASLLFLIQIHRERGDTRAARQILEAPFFGDTEDPTTRMTLSAFEAMVLRSEGKARKALETAESALAARPGEEIVATTYLSVKFALVEKLETAFAAGEETAVLDVVELIEALRPGERPQLLEAHAHRFRGKLTGDASEFGAAIALMRELSLTFWLGVTLLEQSESLVGAGHAEDAGPLLDEAREIFERLEATPWLDRLEQARPGAKVTA